MGIITKEVRAKPSIRYLKLGYKVPVKKSISHECKCEKYLGKHNTLDFSVPFFVKVEDLSKSSVIPLQVECDNCHKIFTSCMDKLNGRNSYKENGKIYCKNCAPGILVSGSNHYKWDKNKTYEQRMKERSTTEYRVFLKTVLKRDNFKCVCCGFKGRLEVHHLNSVNLYPEQIYDISNGVTLCRRCHLAFHSKYGRGNNTLFQFSEWYKNISDLLNKNVELEIPTTKEVYCLETDTIYKSAYEAGKQLNLKANYQGIYNCCSFLRNQKKVAGYHFSWAENVKDKSYNDKVLFLFEELCKHTSYVNPILDLETMVLYECKTDFIKTGKASYKKLTSYKLNLKDICEGKCTYIPLRELIKLNKYEINMILKDRIINIYNYKEVA